MVLNMLEVMWMKSAIFFENAKYSMYISTKGYWHPKQGMMKVDNFGISKRIV